VETPADLAAEDVLLFVNAAITSTGQREFHSESGLQQGSLEFLHEYTAVNYRDLYAAALALGINDHNAALIVLRLLSTARDATPEQRRTEGPLIARTLRRLPPHRVFHLFSALRRARVNNRRTRALMREWLEARPDPAFDAVKYRAAFKTAVRHAHLRPDRLPGAEGELGAFLFASGPTRPFRTPIFEHWRRAHFEQSSVYELPYTVAEGFAAAHGIDRSLFLERIAPRLTRSERLRLQRSAERAEAASVRLDAAALARMPLTRLASYTLSMPVEERAGRRAELTAALRSAARRVAGDRAGTWGKVAAVLDDSYSSSGSSEKRRRPLAVALACDFLLEALAGEYHRLWLTGRDDPLLASAGGATALGSRILDGLELAPERLIVVSDGWDNAPAGMASEVLRVWSTRLDPERRTAVVHLNPVYDAAGLEVRRLGRAVPTTGIRDAEDLPELVAFARFATGRGGMEELRSHLAARVDRYLGEDG